MRHDAPWSTLTGKTLNRSASEPETLHHKPETYSPNNKPKIEQTTGLITDNMHPEPKTRTAERAEDAFEVGEAPEEEVEPLGELEEQQRPRARERPAVMHSQYSAHGFGFQGKGMIWVWVVRWKGGVRFRGFVTDDPNPPCTPSLAFAGGAGAGFGVWGLGFGFFGLRVVFCWGCRVQGERRPSSHCCNALRHLPET